MDFSLLSKETMEMSNKISEKQKKLLFDEEYFCDDISLVESQKIDSVIFPESPGIVFFIDESAGSFCVRGQAFDTAPDLNDKETLIKENRRFSKAETLHWFSCKNIESAEMLCDQIANRRFPFEEESICNISNPGASWWLEIEDRKIKIFFKPLGRKDYLEKLGPIGDSEISKIRWQRAKSILMQKVFDLEVEVTDQLVSLDFKSASFGDSYFNDIVDILRHGKNNFDKTEFSSVEGQTFYLYLEELANTRRFWTKIEDLLADRF